ncbi:dihydrolipoyl dehydrogenase [bacterium]|nr:dihydrolipoyl dehydrogenase [bacterium]
MTHYDGVFIGGGPGGYEAALYAQRLGKKTLILEKYQLGGTCLHSGCIPTKTLLASSKRFLRSQHRDKYGLPRVGHQEVDWTVISERRVKVIEDNTRGLEKLMEAKGVDVDYGIASFLDEKNIRVTHDDGKTTDVSGDKIFIATGSKSAPVSGVQWLDGWVIPGEHCLSWHTLPKSILIVGGGVMGCEFACMFAPFGVKVHIVEMLDDVLPMEDIDVSKTLRRELKKLGVSLYLGKKVENYKQQNGQISLNIEGNKQIIVDKVLVCTGRKAILDNLEIENSGVKLEPHGSIKVDIHQRTNVNNIYSCGDVTGPPLLAHAASYEGKVAVQNAFGNAVDRDLRAIPAGIFTIPEVGRVGMTEQQCIAKGIEYRTGLGHMRQVGRSHAEGDTAGFAKIIVDSKDKIIGGHIVGKQAGEIIHVLALALSLGITAVEFEERIIFSHPTLSEVIWETLKELNV